MAGLAGAVQRDRGMRISSQRRATIGEPAIAKEAEKRICPDEWSKKWHEMMRHQEAQRRERSILKQRLDDQSKLEEERECTFFPRMYTRRDVISRETTSAASRSTTDSGEVDTRRLRDVARELSTAQRRLLECLKDLHDEEAKAAEVIQRKLEGSLEDADMSARVKESHRAHFTRIAEERLNLVFELTKLEHQFYRILQQTNSDSLADCNFDQNLVAKLKEDPKLSSKVTSSSLKISATGTAVTNCVVAASRSPQCQYPTEWTELPTFQLDAPQCPAACTTECVNGPTPTESRDPQAQLNVQPIASRDSAPLPALVCDLPSFGLRSTQNFPWPAPVRPEPPPFCNRQFRAAPPAPPLRNGGWRQLWAKFL